MSSTIRYGKGCGTTKALSSGQAFFAEASHYKGRLEEGNDILFLTGDGHGMYSTVEAVTPPTYIRFIHLGEVINGQKTKKDWDNAFEEYLVEPRSGNTHVQVRLRVVDEYVDSMNDLFPKALLMLKELIENKK